MENTNTLQFLIRRISQMRISLSFEKQSTIHFFCMKQTCKTKQSARAKKEKKFLGLFFSSRPILYSATPITTLLLEDVVNSDMVFWSLTICIINFCSIVIPISGAVAPTIVSEKYY